VAGYLTGVFPPVSAAIDISYGIESDYLDTVIKSQASRSQTTRLDGFGRIAAVINTGDSLSGTLALGKSYRYDGQGRRVFESYPFSWNGPSSEVNADGIVFSYDALGRVTRVSNTADGSYKTYCYMQSCNVGDYGRFFDSTLENGFVVTDELGYQTGFEHRSFKGPDNADLMRVVQQISKANEPGGVLFAVTDITRDIWGKITSVSQGDGIKPPVSRSFHYDEHLFLSEEQNPETGSTVHTYDEVGNRISSLTADGEPIVRKYDGLNRLIEVDYSDNAPDVVTAWLPNGLVSSVDNGITRWSYTYDAENRLTSEVLVAAGETIELIYAYDQLGHLGSVTYPSGDVFQLEPDDFGRPQKFGSLIFDAVYWPDGSIRQLAYGNGYSLQIPQNARQLPEGRVITDGIGQSLLELSFTYDAAANLLSVNDHKGWMYDLGLGYDGLGRLTQADGYWGAGQLAYDAVGNITQKSMGNSSLIYQYSDVSNQLSSVSTLDEGEFLYEYDTYGNVSFDGQQAFTYNSASQLVRADNQIGTTFAYDGNGRRSIVQDQDGLQIDAYSQSGQLVFSNKCETDGITEQFYHHGSELIAREELSCNAGCHP
jgi:YD repeat-containing protein